MNEAFSDACVQGWEPLMEGLVMPDYNDRHVVAAAVRGRAELIVTANLKDFPDSVLKPLGLHALSPGDFLLDQSDLAPEMTLRALRDQAAAAQHPPMTVLEVLDALDRAGLPRFTRQARLLIDS
ncbi:hypothetical protein J7E25_08675 [Agromyces sp. ISL-38]|uniref:PIN domain-containing protein n=1 Tax=Agromyces sp. ISL-38 TaxID=2819107 RepID=UPI001BE5C439|nr:PIN domain-containing protein [Agromyces sp. ISL-38]MBT2499169.1 hypothetical protein [Agromyces sp. ISL-38]